MWIEELDNGKFKYVERYTDPVSGKSRKVSMTHTKKNKRVEKEMFIRLQEKIEERISVRSEEMTFEELSEKWHAVWSQTVKVSTSIDRQSKLNIINAEIGNVDIGQLTAGTINHFILELFDRGFKHASVKGYVTIIKQVIRFGFQYDLISNIDFIQKIEIPRINLSKSNELKYLERHELKSVADQLVAAGHEEMARVFLIQTQTGMRYGELSALDYKKHINLEKQTIRIERTWNVTAKKFETPKSGEPRTIHFNDETKQLIKKQINHANIKKMAKGLRRDNNLLVSNGSNRPYSHTQAGYVLNAHVSIKNKHVTTHIFRHTFITMMVEQGTDMLLIARHVGHKNTDMIQRVYAHFTDKMDKDLRNEINSLDISL